LSESVSVCVGALSRKINDQNLVIRSLVGTINNINRNV